MENLHELKEIITELNSILESENLPTVDRKDLLEVVEDTNHYNGTAFYVVVSEGERQLAAYKLVADEGGVVLVEAWRGTPYVVLQPIMMRVHNDNYARTQVTKMMEMSYSPLDLLITQKGVTGDELLPTISNLSPHELKELHDFVDGMKTALRQMATVSPASATEFYPTEIHNYSDEYEVYEDEALLEHDVYDDYYDDYGEFEYPDEATEVESDYGESSADEADASPNTYSTSYKHYSVPNQSKKEASLATKLLSIFKRK